MNDVEESAAQLIRRAYRKDKLARLIAAAVFRPKAIVPANVWKYVDETCRENCENAAEAVMEYEDKTGNQHDK